MIRHAFRVDRMPAALVGAALVIYLIMALAEIANHTDGMTASLSPYLPLLIGIAWAAPMLARELESGTASWAWGLGVQRRRWLGTRSAPLAAAAVIAGCALGGLVDLSTARWFPSMTQNRITPMLIASALPSIVAFCLLAVAAGLAAAAVTARLVPAIAVTVIVQIALAYAAPSAAVHLAPTRVAPATAVHTGNIVSLHTGGSTSTVRYIANSEYWPIVLAMSLVLIVIAVLLAAVASSRINRLPG